MLKALATLVAGMLATPPPSAEIPLGTSGDIHAAAAQVNGSIELQTLIDPGVATVTEPEGVLKVLVYKGFATPSDVLGAGISDISNSTHSPFEAVRFDNRSHVLFPSDPAMQQSPVTVLLSPSYPLPQTLWPPSTGRYGSFAYDPVSGSYGSSWNQPYWQHADQAAIVRCGAPACQIVFRTGPRECSAIATSNYALGWGAARRPEGDAAILAALQNCLMQVGAQCKIRAADCNP